MSGRGRSRSWCCGRSRCSGAQHGYGIARRIEETSRGKLTLELRHALPGAAQARAGRVHQERVGRVGEQSPREVLSTHRLLAKNSSPTRRVTGRRRRTSSPCFSRRGRRAHEDSQSRSRRACAACSRGASADADMREEFESHLAMHVDENIRRGMSPDEARRDALIAAGGTHGRRRGGARAARVAVGRNACSPICAMRCERYCSTSRLFRGGDPHCGAWHRCQRGDVHDHQCGGPSSAAVSGSGSPRFDFAQGQEGRHGRRRRPDLRRVGAVRASRSRFRRADLDERPVHVRRRSGAVSTGRVRQRVVLRRHRRAAAHLVGCSRADEDTTGRTRRSSS